MNPDVLDSTDRDYLISEVFDFDDLIYSKIKANYSRHVIDLNRPASGEALYQNQTETELCPTTTFDFKQVYKAGLKPDAIEVARRIKLYWQPYHNQLRLLIDTAIKKYGFCLLIDAHSIDDQVPRFFKGKLPDISVGTFAGKSCSVEIEQFVLNELSIQSDFSFVINGRFKGGFITRNYGCPEQNIHAVQLEHAKSVYLYKGMKLSEKSHVLRQFWLKVFDEVTKSY